MLILMKSFSRIYFQDVPYSIDYNSYHKVGYKRRLVKVQDIYVVGNYVVINSDVAGNDLLA